VKFLAWMIAISVLLREKLLLDASC